MNLSILNTTFKKKCIEFFNSGIMIKLNVLIYIAINAFRLFSLYFQDLHVFPLIQNSEFVIPT